jgi:hypothetical protein
MLLAPSVSSLFKWRQFEPEVILLAVGWYLRFSLSYRDVEELLAERGLLVDPSPSGGGFNVPELNRRVRKRRSRKTVALGRIEVAFYAMTQKICTYCDEPATTVGHDYPCRRVSKVRSSLQSCNRSLVAVELTQEPSRIAANAEVKHY